MFENVRYPLTITCRVSLVPLFPPRLEIIDATGAVIAYGKGKPLQLAASLTLSADREARVPLAELRGDHWNLLAATYFMTAANGRKIGSLARASGEQWWDIGGYRHETFVVRGPDETEVGLLRVEHARRKLKGPGADIPLLGSVLAHVTVEDATYTLELPVGRPLVRALFRQGLLTHRLEVTRLEPTEGGDDLIVPTFALLLCRLVRLQNSA